MKIEKKYGSVSWLEFFAFYLGMLVIAWATTVLVGVFIADWWVKTNTIYGSFNELTIPYEIEAEFSIMIMILAFKITIIPTIIIAIVLFVVLFILQFRATYRIVK